MATTTVIANVTIDATGAVVGFEKIEKEIQKAKKETNEFKKEMMSLQRELLQLEAGSEEFNKVSARLSEMKDKLKEVSETVNNNAGPAFESLGMNTMTMVDQFKSMDFEGVAMSMKNMAGNVKRIDMKELAAGVGGAVKSFGALGKALLMNPIFAIGALIAAVIVNFDKLKGYVDGVTSEMTKNLQVAQKTLDVEKSKGDQLANSENILKLQGKSEREILNLKIEQQKAEIAKAKIVISQMDTIAQAQIDAAERNKGIVTGILNFLTIGFRVIAMQIDAIGDGLVKIGILEQGFGLTDKLNQGINSVAEMVFNPTEVREQAAATKAAAEAELLAMENTLAGHQIALKNIDQKGADDRAAKAKEAAEKAIKAKEDALKREIELERWANDEIARMDAEIDAQKIKDIQDQHARDKAEIEQTRAQDAEIQRMVEEMDAAEAARLEKEAADKKKRQADTIAVTEQGLQALSALNELFAGKTRKEQERAFKINKGIRIAEAVIDTYKAANSAMATYPPPFGAIAAAASVAMGLANIAKIKKEKFGGSGGGSGGGGGSSPSVGGGAQGAQGGAPTFNPIDTSFLGNRPPQVAQTYVLAGHVSNAQDANAKISNLRRL